MSPLWGSAAPRVPAAPAWPPSHSPFPLEAYQPLSCERRPFPAVQGGHPGTVLPRSLSSGALAAARADLPSGGSPQEPRPSWPGLRSNPARGSLPSCLMANAAARSSRDPRPAGPSASPDGDISLALTPGHGGGFTPTWGPAVCGLSPRRDTSAWRLLAQGPSDLQPLLFQAHS